MIDLEFVYNVSLHKLHNFHRESGGLRKLVLLNNFVFKKFVSPEQQEQEDPLEWSEEDVKKDEKDWFESCMNDLEGEDGYVYISKPTEYQSTVTPMDCYDDSLHHEDRYIQNNNAMEYERQPNEQQLSKDGKVVDNVIIPHDLLHLPYFDPGGEGRPFHMDIEEEQVSLKSSNVNNTNNTNNTSPNDYDVDMTEVEGYSENLTCEEGFHPYWKDNSIIASSIKNSFPFRPYFKLNTRSFSIPKIFHKYRFGRDYSPQLNAPQFIRELLQSDNLYQSLGFPHYESSPLKRSKDDLDILYSLAPRDLDKGDLMDMISMLEYYGGKTNQKESNSSEINDIWFMGNHL